MSPAPPYDRITLSCGCVLRTEVIDYVNTLIMEPCETDCSNLRDLLVIADEDEIPVEMKLGGQA